MSDSVIKVENLSKLYRLGELHRQTNSFRDKIAQTFSRLGHRSRRSAVGGQPSNSQIWALKDISFEVKQGEVLGIIGRNGAGKSTLLKILSRITKPTDGSAWISGRAGSLLEVGTGFHPELTGRENIYLNGAILGMRKAEIKRKFDEIVDFAEIEKFIDTPVKRYSSGMYVRLAFAVAAHLEPEILLVDEVLAVGDAAFQRKCLGKMHQVGVQGRTVLFVSHNMAAVRNLCSRGVVLDGGHAVFQGDVDSAVERYLRSMDSLHEVSLIHRDDRKGNGLLRVQALRIQDAQGRQVETLQAGEPGTLCLTYLATDGRPLRNVVVAIAFDTLEGSRVCMLQSDHVNADFSTIPRRGTFMCQIPRLALNSGLYVVTVFIVVNGEVADWISRAARVQVVTGDFFGTSKVPDAQDGYLLLDHGWEVVESG